MADSDILIGPGKIWYAPTGEANPDETTVAYGASWGGNWASLGDFLEGNGVTISLDEEFTKVYTEQSTAPVAAVRTKREAMLKATLAEHSVTNMALVLDGTAATTAAGASQKGYTDIPVGSGSTVDFYKWGIEGFRYDSAGTAQPVRYFFHKGYIRLAGDISMSKANPTGVPVEITLLADRSQSAGSEIGLWQQVTAAATA